jgi:hypothetical protein
MFQDDRFDRLLEEYIAAAEQVGRHLEQIENILRDARPIHVVIDNWPTQTPPPTTGAVKAVLTLTGDNGMSVLTVDTTTGALKTTFDDDKGDTDAAAPAGAVSTFSVGPDPAKPGVIPATTVDPASGAIVVGPEGDSGVFIDSLNGTALKADGTAIADPSPLAFAIAAGAAVTANLTQTQ